jgi:hypothetical protein
MKFFYRSEINVGGKPKILVCINHKNEAEQTESKSVDSLHHIHILDRSYSMNGSIDDLIENVKRTIEYIPENDYVSIIWFSSAGNYKTLIKGAKKDLGLFKLLDSIKSTLGCTCFSESLKEVGVIIEDLSMICQNYNVTLFTDGQAVVPWSDTEEESRMFKAIDAWKDKVIALNTVGYGNYYNQELLKKVASTSMFGQFVHSSKIAEYMDIFSHNYERVSDLVIDSVNIDVSSEAEILYINSKTTKMDNNCMKMSMLEKKKNQFVIVMDKDSEFVYNGETYKSSDILTSISKTSVTPILYAYAYEQYYKGNRQYALDIIASTLKDKFLVDEQFKAFTFDECGNYGKNLQKSVFSSLSRYREGMCGDNYLPASDAFCIMDLLKILVNGNSYYVYSSNYQRIGLKTTDTFNLFTKNEGDMLTPIDEIILNKDKLNVSLRSIIHGKVKLNPIQADKVGLPHSMAGYQYKNQTLIKDGSLNIIEVRFDVDAFTLKLIEEKNIGGLITSVNDSKYSGLHAISLNLSVLPVVNRTYLDDNGQIDNVWENTFQQTVLEVQQKTLNYFMKKLKEGIKESVPSNFDKCFTVEQIDILKEHGLKGSLEYVGVALKKEEKNETDFYEARVLDFDIKGYSSIPPIEKVLAKIKDNGKLNGPETIAKDFITSIENTHNISLKDKVDPKLESVFEDMLSVVKRDLMNLRLDLASMKIAKVLTGDWFDNLTPDGKGKYTYIKEDKTLVVKTEKVKVYFS